MTSELRGFTEAPNPLLIFKLSQIILSVLKYNLIITQASHTSHIFKCTVFLISLFHFDYIDER